ncbi:MAG: 50S ribosomal protein L15 [Bdellovibrionales bacterium]|nr:50S ribosomal protein L15 [Bdellovibrionales bacterium]NQZ17695.1 50S ribosomal protein L15 [Bdellovibrionales bacterium]
MSLLAELAPNKGATHKKKRVGRGDGSNWGGTAGKGHKGQKARSGGTVKRGFEGGQTPLHRRLPKFGFKNTQFKNNYVIINLHQLNSFDGEVSPEALVAKGFLKKTEKLKVLANGKLDKSLTVKAHKFSEAAKTEIEKAGGKVEVI